VSELKDCPFCNGYSPELAESAVTSVITGRPKMGVFCNDCFCEGPTADSEEEAIEAWNRRAPASEGEQK
jgi:Lar family restriction alleviation protein